MAAIKTTLLNGWRNAVTDNNWRINKNCFTGPGFHWTDEVRRLCFTQIDIKANYPFKQIPKKRLTRHCFW